MEVTVKRDIFNDDCTLGNLSVDGQFVCYTLEDAYREDPSKSIEDWKIPGMTAIPKGRYPLVINYSNKFGRYLCELLSVPLYTGVRIHPGNTSADTEGCILLGIERTNNMVQHSKDAVALFQPMVQSALNAGKDCWITIE
jgi:hypothetical protein